MPFSHIQIKLSQQPDSPKHLLIADLDDTYLYHYTPTPSETQGLSQKEKDLCIAQDAKVYQPTVRLHQYLLEKSIPLILCSGRDMVQYRELRNAFQSQHPDLNDLLDCDAYIGAMGTEIYFPKSHEYHLDPEYEALMHSTGFNREKIVEFGGKLAEIVNQNFPHSQFDFQNRDKPNSMGENKPLKWKVSFEFSANLTTSAQIKETIKRALQDNKLFSLITLSWQTTPTDNTEGKFNLDLTAGSKKTAVNYLMKKIALQFPDLKVFTAGDSGNDYEMLFETNSLPIVSPQAKEELLKTMHANSNVAYYYHPEDLTPPDSICMAIENNALIAYN